MTTPPVDDLIGAYVTTDRNEYHGFIVGLAEPKNGEPRYRVKWHDGDSTTESPRSITIAQLPTIGTRVQTHLDEHPADGTITHKHMGPIRGGINFPCYTVDWDDGHNTATLYGLEDLIILEHAPTPPPEPTEPTPVIYTPPDTTPPTINTPIDPLTHHIHFPNPHIPDIPYTQLEQLLQAIYTHRTAQRDHTEAWTSDQTAADILADIADNTENAMYAAINDLPENTP